ncbi:DUF1674 domain-containing protein [Rhodovibrionaceae bacterium A322]
MKSFKSHQPAQQAPRTAGSVVGTPPSISKDKLEEAAWEKEMAAKAAAKTKAGAAGDIGTKGPKPTGAAGDTPQEVGGPEGLEPTRYGDWERNGICYDF